MYMNPHYSLHLETKLECNFEELSSFLNVDKKSKKQRNINMFYQFTMLSVKRVDSVV